MRLDTRSPDPDPITEGQATYGMANLRPERTGLAFIVFISQREDARHAARVKVSPAPRVKKDQMGSYAVSPFGLEAGCRLSADEEAQLGRWVALNRETVQRYWDGEIEYTEDALEQMQSV